MLKIKILSENYARKRGLLSEHGLSIWIENNGVNILFDTGQSNIFYHNAKKLGIDIKKADMLVLSHGHYDHTGGVSEFCKANDKAPIYIHKDAFYKRYSKFNNEYSKNIGIPWSKNENCDISKRLILNKKSVNITENIMISGEIPGMVSFEDVPQSFYINDGTGSLAKDMITDEQMLLIKGKKGIYIFVGCSHPGVVNCVRYAQKLFPREKIAGLIGGMHLEKIQDIRLQMTIQSFIDLNIKNVIPLHCTGIIPICKIKRFLGKRCNILNVGDEFILEE